MTDKTEAQPEALELADEQDAAVATLQNLGYTYQGGILWKPPLGKAPDFNMLDSLRAHAASLEDRLIAQANRAVIAEQQVTALTQRLDMANRLNTDARGQLAQLSARQAAPDGWRLVPAEPTEEMVTAGQESFGVHDCYYAMLSAAPPPPEREPLRDDGKYTITIEHGSAQARFVITEMQIESAPSLAEYVGHAVAKAIAAIDKRRVSHGIGATNAR